MLPRPTTGDHPDYFQPYVDLAPDGDVLRQLTAQASRMRRMLADAGERKGAFAYAEGKWTVKQIVQHLADGERMFCYRALCAARGETQDLPSFDQHLYAANDGSANRTLADIVAEYAAVRGATVDLFGGLDANAMQRRGTANGQAFAVLALPWIVLGHDIHHCSVLQERYGLVEPV